MLTREDSHLNAASILGRKRIIFNYELNPEIKGMRFKLHLESLKVRDILGRLDCYFLIKNEERVLYRSETIRNHSDKGR